MSAHTAYFIIFPLPFFLSQKPNSTLSRVIYLLQPGTILSGSFSPLSGALETDFQFPYWKDCLLFFFSLYHQVDHFPLSYLHFMFYSVNLETNTPFSYSKAIDINRNLLWRYPELSHLTSREDPFISCFAISPPSLSTPSAIPAHSFPRMNSFIKITPFNGAHSDLS